MRPQSSLWMLRRTSYVLRTEGLRSLARRALGRTVYGRMAVLQLDLDDTALDHSSPVSLNVQRLRPEHFRTYLSVRPDLAGGEIERRIARGDRCYVTWTAGQITSSIWFGSGSVRMTELAASMELESDQAFCYDNWTTPELRGQNISATREASTCAILRDAGYRSLVGHFFVRNAAALRPPMKLGFKRVAVLTSIRLGWLRLDHTKWSDGASEWKLGRHRRGGIRLSGPPALRLIARSSGFR